MEKQITATIMKRLDEYSEDHQDNKNRQTRLKELTHKYDVATVALAAGFTIATLTQYLRVSHAVPINENSVLKAERVLKGL